MKIKTIDITAKEWFDKVNGNSYFSARVTLNFKMKNEKILLIPYRYGYGDQFTIVVKDRLIAKGLIENAPLSPLWRTCENMNIILRTNKIKNCLKREVVGFGQE